MGKKKKKKMLVQLTERQVEIKTYYVISYEDNQDFLWNEFYYKVDEENKKKQFFF